MPYSTNLHRLERFVIDLSDKRAFVFSFAFGFIIRLIPELLSYPNPIGFDTVYYAASIKSGVIWSSWTMVFSMGLFEGALTAINKIAQINPFLLLKLVVPLLYGLNVCGIYYFSRKALNWSSKQSLIAVFFFAFQLAALRISWDLDKNLLGMAILLFALPLIKRINTKKNFVMLLTLSVLVVLSHVLAAAVLFAAILVTFLDNWLKKEKSKSYKLSAAVLPALAVLLVSLLVLPSASFNQENVIVSGDTVHQRPGGLFFLVNYLSVSDDVQNYPTYLNLVLHVFSLFGILYLWWLPLVLVGLFRDSTLGGWTLILLFGSFNALITPFGALNWWNRWMFMLVYPFTFYAINGVGKLSKSENKSVISKFRSLKWVKVTRKTVLGVFSLTIILGSIFLAVPPFFDRFGVFFIPTTTSYLPSAMLYNTVPLRDVETTVQTIEWLNENMNNGSVVIVHHAFFWWAAIYLDKKHLVLYFEKDIEKTLGIALERGFNPIYMIWWNEDYFVWQNQTIGWYGVSVPKYFKYIFSSDRISILQYSTI